MSVGIGNLSVRAVERSWRPVTLGGRVGSNEGRGKLDFSVIPPDMPHNTGGRA
jgi:hypothetical protein